MIKKIYCFGTSFTEGGGFEFDSNPTIKLIYSGLGERITKFNFSWPGQLQKLLTDIEVINFAKSGFGNERMYRLASDLVLSDDFNKDETLFLLEFSHLGRKEYYSKNLKDYVTVNYSTPLNDENQKYSKFVGVARTYNQIKEVSDSELAQLPDSDWFNKWIGLTINQQVQHELTVNNSTIFLSFLKERNVKFLQVESASYVNPIYWDDLITPYLVKNLKDNSIYTTSYSPINGQIEQETYGYHQDKHFGLISNKLIASCVHDELIDRKIIKGTKLNKKRKDFDYIQKNLLKNYNFLKND